MILLIFLGTLLFAQNDKLTSARIAYISQHVKLTPDQAQLFWPLFNEYSDRKKEIKQLIKKLKIDNNTPAATEQDLVADIKKLQNYKQQELNLEKEYTDKFLKVIGVRQYLELLKAEKEFKILLLKKLQESE